jgi:hypothetical protein
MTDVNPVEAMWSKLVSHATGPYDVRLDVGEGDELTAPPPYPYLKVLASKVVQARRLCWQVVDVEAQDPEHPEARALLRFGRLVAELEGGGEVELDRHPLPLVDPPARAADPSTCGACDQHIPQGTGVEHEGAWYHRRCMGG